MVQILVAVSSIYISWVDLREHRIYHRDLLIFGLILVLDAHPTVMKNIGALLLLSLLFTLVFRIGGGDFKLFSVFLLVQGELVISIRYLNYFLVSLSVSILIATLRHGTFRCAVPLAPAIVTPFLATYLGM
jgi:Flp pilus assembly protein protease CpaA